MQKSKAVQIGMGPLGRMIAGYICQRPGLELIGAVDTDPSVVGKSCRELCGADYDIVIRASLDEVVENEAATLDESEKKKETGTLRHVGLTESMHFIAAALGWELDETQDVVSPVIAKQRIVSESLTIEQGAAAGVEQIGRRYARGDERITLVFWASVGEPRPEDRVEISGEPSIVSRIEGGVGGDVATCSITLNAIPRVLESAPGLRTMLDIAPLSCSFSG